MICIYHSKDMDGYTSGALVKRKYPDCKLIGWDYKDPIPDLEQFRDQEIIMIDCTFPIQKIEEIRKICTFLTIIDHHISFKNTFVEVYTVTEPSNTTVKLEYIGEKLRYVYELGKAACEIGWEYLFPNEKVPEAITLIGRYDTWRQEEGDWERETLPFKYFMYGECNSPQTFPTELLEYNSHQLTSLVDTGLSIMKYQRTMDEATCRQYAFEREVYGLRAICVNIPFFSSETVASLFDPKKHDIMIGFACGGEGWRVSLRSESHDVNCSQIAKTRGGGGHVRAAGFETKEFENIFI